MPAPDDDRESRDSSPSLPPISFPDEQEEAISAALHRAVSSVCATEILRASGRASRYEGAGMDTLAHLEATLICRLTDQYLELSAPADSSEGREE